MNRLTERDEYGNADITALSDTMPEIYAGLSFSETNALTGALNRLAAYEDTELTPKEILALKASVVHAYWTERKAPYGDVFDYSFKCSCCHQETPERAYVIAPDYCPNCGAKMDRKDKDDDWIEVRAKKPPENQVVQTKIDDVNGVRNEQKLIYSNNLWWLPDKSMYVYYTPTHWRAVSSGDVKMDEKDGK